MCIKHKQCVLYSVPKVFLYNQPITLVDKYKYLGAIINCDGSDDSEMAKQMQNLYARGNVLINNLSKCRDPVKCELFKTYCTSCYGSHLWHMCKEES